MAEEHFRVVYDGAAVEDGEMDAAQLASSLLALAHLLKSADDITTGERDRLSVRVRADVRRGSFDVGMAIHWKDAILAWAMTPAGGATLSLLGVLGFNLTAVATASGRGVIQVVRWLRGRRIASRARHSGGAVTIVAEDGEELVVDPQVSRLADDAGVRQALEKFTEPLREEGVESIRFEPSEGEGETILASEAEFFRAVAGTAPTSSSEFEATYQIKRLFFERGRKWRLSNGAQTIQAEIIDDRFWAQIDASERSFAKEDYLVCRVRMDQWLTPTGLRTEYVILEVVEHLSPAKQDALL